MCLARHVISGNAATQSTAVYVRVSLFFANPCVFGCRISKKRENAKVEVFKAAGKGMGLRLLEPVSKGQFIAEYVGEVRGLLYTTASTISLANET